MKSLLLILLLGLSTAVFGQEPVLSKIKLKNGTSIKGRVVENKPGDYITIMLTEDQFSTIDYADIISIRDQYYHYDSQFKLEKGLNVEGSYAFMFGKAGGMDELRVGMSLGVTASYRFRSYLALGAGVEINTLYVNSDFLLVPMYARISGSLTPKKVAPYYIFDFGWSTASTGEEIGQDFDMEGGFLFRPEIGVRVNQVRIGVGYQNQVVHTRYTTNFWWGGEQIIEEDRVLRNIRLGVSVIF